MSTKDTELSFWDHIDCLRAQLFKVAAVILVGMVVIFCFKTPVFRLVLAPCDNDFMLYRWVSGLLSLVHLPPLETFNLSLVNIELSQQFFIHLKVSMLLSVVLTAPLCVYFLWGFVAPGLYENEKKAARRAFGFASLLFYLGVVTAYVFIFPLTLRFLGTYSVSSEIANTISLSSYISMFVGLILVMGLVFELPCLMWLLNRIGIVSRKLLASYRRHAFVILMILAAVITPSGDIFTLSIVTLPLYLLYEVSIRVCK